MSLRRTSRHLIRSGLAIGVWLIIVIVTLGKPAFAADVPAAPKIGHVEIGLKNFFKVGFWTPIRIEIESAESANALRVEVSVADNDGVPTTVSEPILPVATSGGKVTATLYTKVGRVGSPLHVVLYDEERRLDEFILRPDTKAKPHSMAIALPATADLIASLESATSGLRDAFPTRESEGNQPARQFISLSQISDLPTSWWGYDAVDVLVVSAADGKICHDLAADTPRLAALTRWVEMGGRLVIQCDGTAGKELFSSDGPLARFAPGRLAEQVRLPETGALEHFAGSSTPISLAPGNILRVLRFVDVPGVIEAHAGKKSSDLPLVVRSPLGLGEVAFAAVDFSQPIVANWVGRSAFFQALLRPYLSTSGGTGDAASQRLVTRGYNDLAGALRQRLGMSFTSVVPISFAIVALLALLYIAFLGPLDYLFVNRWVRKPLVAWVTFPLLVLAFSGATMSLSSWRTGGREPRVNRLELVDIDTLSGLTRGTLWSVLYNPVATRFNLSIAGPQLPVELSEREILFSWWGLPGAGIGGMLAGGMDLGMVTDGYRYSTDRRSLLGLPVLTSATKSLITRWTAQSQPMIQSDLVDQEGLATGVVTNLTQLTLRNVRLLYGQWAYRLGNIGPGNQIEVGEQISPRKTKTIVTHDSLGESTSQGSTEGKMFVPEAASANEILRLMMFYNAVGGLGFAHLPNRFLAFIDMSRTIELGRAILVADAPGPAAHIVVGESDNRFADNQDDSTVIYRFVLPVKRQSGP